MNTYSKFTANVFVAKCSEQHAKGELITLTSKYGQEHECVVFNLVATKDGFYYYSIVRSDGFNYQTYCQQRAQRFEGWANSAENKANQYFQASQEGRDFLSLGEPIKVGHHSEKRHRALIERNHERMGKCIEKGRKAEAHESKAQYWERKASGINLSMPESVDFYEYKLEQATAHHAGLKDGSIPRAHSYSLTYAKNAVNEASKNLATAKKLWL